MIFEIVSNNSNIFILPLDAAILKLGSDSNIILPNSPFPFVISFIADTTPSFILDSQYFLDFSSFNKVSVINFLEVDNAFNISDNDANVFPKVVFCGFVFNNFTASSPFVICWPKNRPAIPPTISINVGSAFSVSFSLLGNFGPNPWRPLVFSSIFLSDDLICLLSS